MWQRWSYTGPSHCIFRRKGTDEELESTVCPKCGLEMVVLSDVLEGIDIRDENIETVCAIRGI